MSKVGQNPILLGIAWTYFGVILQGILKLFSLGILARLINPDQFGLLSCALICTGLVERLGQLGIGPTLVQRRILTHQSVYVARRLTLVLGIVAGSVVFFTSDACARFFNQPELRDVLRVLSLGCLLEACAVVPDALLQRRLAFKQIVAADNRSYVVGMVLVCPLLAWQGFGVWALVYSMILMKAIRWFLLAMTAPRRGIVGRWSFSKAREILDVGLGFSLARILNCVSLQGDNFVVGKMFGVDVLGLYTRGYQLMTLPAIFLGQIYERVMFPAMAKLQLEESTLNQQFLLSIEVMTLIALPASVVTSLCAEEIVSVVFGERWLGVVPIVSVLSYGVFFRTTYKCSDTVVRAKGAVYVYALRQGLYGVFVLGGALIGASISGSVGVAWGVVVAVALNYISLTLLAKQLIDTSFIDLIRAHVPGFALFLWCWMGLAVYLPLVREYCLQPFFGGVVTLLLSLVVWGTGALLTLALSIGRVSVLCKKMVAEGTVNLRKIPLVNRWRDRRAA